MTLEALQCTDITKLMGHIIIVSNKVIDILLTASERPDHPTFLQMANRLN